MQALISVSFWLRLRFGQIKTRLNMTMMVLSSLGNWIVTEIEIYLKSFAMMLHTISGKMNALYLLLLSLSKVNLIHITKNLSNYRNP